MTTKPTKDQLLTALNKLDQFADMGTTEFEDLEALTKDYELVADFINDNA